MNQLSIITFLVIAVFLSACDVTPNDDDLSNDDAINSALKSRSTQQYSLGGQVIGLSGTISLSNNGNGYDISKNGSFSFPSHISPGTDYQVSIIKQPEAQQCELLNSTGKIQNSDVSSIVLVCKNVDAPISETPIPSSFTVSLFRSSGGRVSPAATQTVFSDETVSFSLTPDTGFEIGNVFGCGGNLSESIFTTAPVNENCEVTINFALKRFELNYSAVNGTIVGAQKQIVGYGASGSNVTAVPNTGYQFVRWSDGVTSNTRTDSGITTNIGVTAEFVIRQFNLTYRAGANGSLSGVTQQRNIDYGTNGSLVTAQANSGFHFEKWSDGSIQNPRTDNNVISNIDVTAEFALNDYTITVSVGAGGTVTPAGNQFAQHGLTRQFTLTPNAGYAIGSATGCGGTLNGGLFTTAAITANCTVSFNFSLRQYTLQYRAGSNGNINGPGTTTQVVNHGGSGTAVNATPNTGYRFVSWSDNSTQNPRTDTNVTANINVTATFALNSYLVTVNASTGGTVTPAGNQTVDHGQTRQFTLTPNTGYAISSATGCGGTLNGGLFTTAAITANCTVSFNFSLRQYTLQYRAGSNGNINGPGTTTQVVNHGGSGTAVNATPNTGYRFVSWSDNSTQNPRTDTNVTSNIDVTATFAINSYLITVNTSFGGTVTPTGNQTVDHGQTRQFTLTPNTGYTIGSATGCGGTLNGGVFTTAAITANCTVSFSFALRQYTLQYSAGPNGNINGPGTTTQVVNHGGSGTAVNATPNTGYHFVSWSDNSTQNPRTDTNVTGDISVTANFAINSYSVVINTSAGGTATPNGTQSVQHGSTLRITLQPNTGYFVSSVTGCNGTLIPTPLAYDAVITSACTINIQFQISNYTVSYIAGSGGTISGVATQTVNHGSSSSTVTAVANNGYEFTGWSDGSIVNPRNDINVTSNISVTANFALNVPPVITTPLNLSASEFDRVITRISVNDATISPRTFRISGGADSTRFGIDQPTGLLSFIDIQNSRSPNDANADGVYDVAVIVNDGVYDSAAVTFFVRVMAMKRLNDTGVWRCNDTVNLLACPQSLYPGQDAEFGRDFTNYDVTDGSAGFSYTKLDSLGQVLPRTATNHACVRDNITGVVWEVKSISNYTLTYTSSTQADTFISGLNTSRYCGYSDWRLPTTRELLSIVSYDANSPAIDYHFPRTSAGLYRASEYAANTSYYWTVNFATGAAEPRLFSTSAYVRAVRGN